MLRLIDWIFLALTVYMEAEGEGPEGQLAVAWTIANRARARRRSLVDTCLEPRQFSCWDTVSARRMVLDELQPAAWDGSVKAAAAAFFGLGPDPSNGATHYLNPDAVRAFAGKLPSWAADPADPLELDRGKVRATVGRHAFLIA